jgi:hypothetical protein
MRRYARLGAYVASLTLAVSTVTAIAPSAQAAPVKDPIGVNAGASWLETQLTNGLVHNKQFNFDDYGLTLDFGLALQAVGGHASTVTAIKNAMASHVNDYVTPFGGPHSYTGALAKLALFVGHPADNNFGGQDLITQLEGRVATASPIAGRIQDAGYTPGDQFDDDSANVLGQAYAVAALHNAGSSNTTALSFLLDQQCPNGGFRLSFTASKSAAGQSCTDNSQAQIDATSVALIELKAIGQTGAPVNNATSYLIGKQASSGAWGGDPGGAAENANATGLAAWALGNTAQSAEGAAWLRDHQATFYDYCDLLKTDVGAIAYSTDTLNSGRVEGIITSSQDQFRRAAAQALPGLQYLDEDATPAAPQLTGPSGYQKSNSFVNFRVTGVHAGDQLCLTGGPGGARAVSTGTSQVIREVLPFGTAIRTFAVRDRDGHSDTTTVNVLGAKTLPLTRSNYNNKRSSFVTVSVYGLAPGEHAGITFRGALKASGTADSAGHFRRSIWTGRKLGKGTIAAYGQFGDIRKGYALIKVVR